MFESPHAVGVWCAVSGHKIIGPVFFKEIKNNSLLLTSRSRHLNPCSCYMWGALKGTVHVNNPRAYQKIIKIIFEEKFLIFQDKLLRVSRRFQTPLYKVDVAASGLSYDIKQVRLQGTDSSWPMQASHAIKLRRKLLCLGLWLVGWSVFWQSYVQWYRRPRQCLETFLGGGSYENPQENQVNVVFGNQTKPVSQYVTSRLTN